MTSCVTQKTQLLLRIGREVGVIGGLGEEIMAEPPALSVQHLDPNRCPDQPLITWARGEEDPFTLSLSEVKKVCHTQRKFLSLCAPSHPQHLTLFDTLRDYLLLRRLEQPSGNLRSGEPDIIMEAFTQSILAPGIGKLERPLGCTAQTAWPLFNPLKSGEQRALTGNELEAFTFHALRGLHRLAVAEPDRSAEVLLAVANLYKQLSQRGMAYALLSEWQQESLQVFASLFAFYPAKGWESTETITDSQTFKSTTESCRITTTTYRTHNLLSAAEKDATIEFLGSLVIPKARNKLVGLLGKEKDPKRREQIVQAIGHFGREGLDDQGLKALEDTLEGMIRNKEEASRVRGAAIISLALITRRPMKAMVEPFLNKDPTETLAALTSLQIPALTVLYYEGSEESLGLMRQFYDDLLSDEAKQRATAFFFGTRPRMVKLPIPNGTMMSYRVTARSDGPLDLEAGLNHPAIFAYFTNRLGNNKLPETERRYAALILLLQGHRNSRAAQWVADLLLDNKDREAAALLRGQLKELPDSVTVTWQGVTNRDRLKISPRLSPINAHAMIPPISLKMEWRGEKDPRGDNLEAILSNYLDLHNMLLVMEVPEAFFSDQTGKDTHEDIKQQMAQIIDPFYGVDPDKAANRTIPHSIKVILYETPSEQWRVGVGTDVGIEATGKIDLSRFEWQGD